MSSMLFLRSTEQIAKLHLVAELGRIGDARGTLPVMQFIAEPEDERGRGTAVFALGEIGSEKATPLLKRIVTEDRSPMVRRLAQEALRKIDGELPPSTKSSWRRSKTRTPWFRPIRSSQSCASSTRNCRTRSVEPGPSRVRRSRVCVAIGDAIWSSSYCRLFILRAETSRLSRV